MRLHFSLAYLSRLTRLTLPIVAVLALLAVGTLPVRAEDDDKVAARSTALELAGAFTANDGYKLRDGFYSASLKVGESRLVTINLYAGNSYWFCAASSNPSCTTDVLVFDEAGQPVPILTYASGGKSAAGLTPATSGMYYVKIALSKGKSSPVCFLYTYK